MSTGFIYNGFGQYEENANGEKGITLFYGGVPFFLPFQQVTAIPDYTFREVDHEKSADPETEGRLVYRTIVVSGARIVEELTEVQVPVKNREKGILAIYPHERKFTGKHLTVNAGVSEEGRVLTAEVRELEPAQEEVKKADKLALAYKKQMINDYFRGKRESMAGKPGHLTYPAGNIQLYMEELNIEDIDDVSAHQKGGGISAEIIKLIIEETRRAGEINGAELLRAIETVRKTGKAQPTQLHKSGRINAGAAAFKAARDAAIAEGKTPEEATAIAKEVRQAALASS